MGDLHGGRGMLESVVGLLTDTWRGELGGEGRRAIGRWLGAWGGGLHLIQERVSGLGGSLGLGPPLARGRPRARESLGIVVEETAETAVVADGEGRAAPAGGPAGGAAAPVGGTGRDVGVGGGGGDGPVTPSEDDLLMGAGAAGVEAGVASLRMGLPAGPGGDDDTATWVRAGGGTPDGAFPPPPFGWGSGSSGCTGGAGQGPGRRGGGGPPWCIVLNLIDFRFARPWGGHDCCSRLIVGRMLLVVFLCGKARALLASWGGVSCGGVAASPLVGRWVSAPCCPPVWDVGVHGPLGVSAAVWGGRDRLAGRSVGSGGLGQSGPGCFGRWVGCGQSEAVLPFGAGDACVRAVVTSRLL